MRLTKSPNLTLGLLLLFVSLGEIAPPPAASATDAASTPIISSCKLYDGQLLATVENIPPGTDEIMVRFSGIGAKNSGKLDQFVIVGRDSAKEVSQNSLRIVTDELQPSQSNESEVRCSVETLSRADIVPIRTASCSATDLVIDNGPIASLDAIAIEDSHVTLLMRLSIEKFFAIGNLNFLNSKLFIAEDERIVKTVTVNVFEPQEALVAFQAKRRSRTTITFGFLDGSRRTTEGTICL